MVKELMSKDINNSPKFLARYRVFELLSKMLMIDGQQYTIICPVNECLITAMMLMTQFRLKLMKTLYLSNMKIYFSYII